MKKLITLLFCLVAAVSSYAQANNSVEEVESMMISSITRYIEWSQVSGDFNIAVVNKPIIAKHLTKYFANRKIQGTNVIVSELPKNATNFDGVEILVSSRLHVSQENLLTINIDNTNAIMNIVQEDDKVKIKIRKAMAVENKLKISSALANMIQIID